MSRLHQPSKLTKQKAPKSPPLSLGGKSLCPSLMNLTSIFITIANAIQNVLFRPSHSLSLPLSLRLKSNPLRISLPTCLCILALPTMEAFSLLNYWRGGGGAPLVPDICSSNSRSPSTVAATTIVTAIADNAVETDDDDDDDDGPFFDLDFAVPDEAEDSEEGHEYPDQSHSSDMDSAHQSVEEEDDDEFDGGDVEREFKFTLSPSCNDRSDPNLTLSPTEDLFFKGKLVQVEPSSFVLNSSESNSKSQFPASLLKSATKFRVFMLGLKKSKSNAAVERESNGSDSLPSKQPESQQPEGPKKQQQPEQQQQKKFFTVKFKVEEVPMMSLFTRDNSSRGGPPVNKSQKQNTEETLSSTSDDKRFSKEVVQKYLKMVKPLYIRVSRRYGDKLRLSGQLNLNSGVKGGTTEQKPAPAKPAGEKAQSEATDASETPATNIKSQKQGSLPTGLRVVCKHLGKSRSASSAVAAAPPGMVSSRRRDDSLLQQQDGIQGAILHCKRSFNASRECCESSQLPRSVSDPLHDISPGITRKSSEKSEENRG